MKPQCPTRRLALAAAILLPLAACVPFGDPAGPSASGTMRVGDGVDVAAFSDFHVAVYPDPGSFDPAEGLPDDPDLVLDDLSVDEVDFPYAYLHGRDLGTSDQSKWRIVAWLSTDAMADTPEPGDVYGTRTFSVHSCGRYGGYCDTTDGVDFTVDTPIP